MSIIRLVHVTYPDDKADTAARVWKERHGRLLSSQPGCRSEELLRCADVPGEFVSSSIWDDEDSIRRYLDSEAYDQIRSESRELGAYDVTVRLYVPA